MEVEFMVLINAYEETFAQTVHARNSYRFEEIIYGARFTPIISPGEKGSVIIELNRINEHELAPLQEEVSVM